MKLTAFGSTGKTGRLLVERALEGGHEVIAFARSPERLRIEHERLTLAPGDVLERERVDAAVRGSDAVISVLGPTDRGARFVVSRGTRNIIAAMHAHSVRRLIVTAGAGVADPADRPTMISRLFDITLRIFSWNVYEDMAQVVRLVRASDLDWTVVRVPMLTDGPGGGSLRVGYIGKGAGPRLVRSDLAEFLLDQLEDRTYLRKAPVVSSG